jgi:Radical SAM superfamily/B12 binding domain
MKITLCTSPHLDRSPLFDGRDRYARSEPLPLAQTFLPMGLLSLASAVKDLAQVRIFDVNKQINAGGLPLSGHLYSAAAELILADDPEVVGFMTDCDSFHHVLRICSSLKARRPETVIVLGCVHASYNAAEILSRYTFVNYVVRGEGEVAFRELLEALAGSRRIGDVGNLSYRADGAVTRNADLPLIPDLDTLPWIDPQLIGLEANDAVWLEIGRGCPFKCNFCVTAPYWQRRHRIKSPERIIAELRMFRDTYGRRDFNFTHDLFTTDRRWVLKFSAALAAVDLGVTWTCSSRTDTLDEEQLAAMAKAGCRDIYFGVETGTAAMQTAIDKGLGLNESRKIIQACHRYGVSTTVGFIAGLPGESQDSLTGTLREAASYLRMDRTIVHLFGYCPYRGSSGFARIEDELVPETQFVDFPIEEKTDIENRTLIQTHRDVFARYSRMASHRSDGFDAVLEVAEEYFPILNTVPRLTSYLIEAGVEPYDQLSAWAGWLWDRSTAGPRRLAHAHMGTIGDFLDFAEEFVGSRGIGGDRFNDLVKWERMKQAFRSQAPDTELTPDTIDLNGGTEIRLNPTVRLAHFRYPLDANADSPDHVPADFAFLRRRDGDAGIVRVGLLAKAIMELADGEDVGGLTSALEDVFRSDDVSDEGFARSVSATLEQLVTSEIVYLR